MGTVPQKKKLGSKLPTTAFDPQALVPLIKITATLADSYDSALAAIKPEMSCPQSVMRAAFVSPELTKHAGRFSSAFSKFATQHRLGDGGFIHEADEGKSLMVVGFPVSGGLISPKWKEEAFRLAEELAKLRGEVWDAEGFEAEVRSRTTPSKTSVGFSLTEAE